MTHDRDSNKYHLIHFREYCLEKQRQDLIQALKNEITPEKIEILKNHLSRSNPPSNAKEVTSTITFLITIFEQTNNNDDKSNILSIINIKKIAELFQYNEENKYNHLIKILETLPNDFYRMDLVLELKNLNLYEKYFDNHEKLSTLLEMFLERGSKESIIFLLGGIEEIIGSFFQLILGLFENIIGQTEIKRKWIYLKNILEFSEDNNAYASKNLIELCNHLKSLKDDQSRLFFLALSETKFSLKIAQTNIRDIVAVLSTFTNVHFVALLINKISVKRNVVHEICTQYICDGKTLKKALSIIPSIEMKEQLIQTLGGERILSLYATLSHNQDAIFDQLPSKRSKGFFIFSLLKEDEAAANHALRVLSEERLQNISDSISDRLDFLHKALAITANKSTKRLLISMILGNVENIKIALSQSKRNIDMFNANTCYLQWIFNAIPEVDLKNTVIDTLGGIEQALCWVVDINDLMAVLEIYPDNQSKLSFIKNKLGSENLSELIHDSDDLVRLLHPFSTSKQKVLLSLLPNEKKNFSSAEIECAVNFIAYEKTMRAEQPMEWDLFDEKKEETTYTAPPTYQSCYTAVFYFIDQLIQGIVNFFINPPSHLQTTPPTATEESSQQKKTQRFLQLFDDSFSTFTHDHLQNTGNSCSSHCNI